MFGTLHLGNLSAANIASVRRSLSTFPESFLSQILHSPKLGVMSLERWQTQPSTNATMRSVGKLPAAAPTKASGSLGEGGFARLLAAIDNFTAVPSTFIDGDHVVVLGRYGGHDEKRRRDARIPVLPRVPVSRRRAVTFQQYTDTAQWARLMA